MKVAVTAAIAWLVSKVLRPIRSIADLGLRPQKYASLFGEATESLNRDKCTARAPDELCGNLGDGMI